ncbi:hypothetical protein C9I87_05460 [Photobacterium iliopiscarium]|uniref:hypothetical protein n=1 Tax=Photobacterium iliopiscarium TaxID=56192 RepID=UPI000D17193F|nr:hypothetical protein [Photobacterium iliopiscarium]PST95992.1 hypothetical protein C9I87_05460 [Photobacterium iliopiscarium]
MLGELTYWTLLTINPYLTTSYIAAKATDLFNGDDFGISFTHPPKEKEALIAANKQAKAKADSVRKVIYIDGAHPRIF